MPEITNEQLLVAVAAAAALALVATIVAMASLRRLRTARREYMTLRGGAGDRDILEAVDKILKKLKSMEERVDSLSARQEAQAAVGRFAVRRFDLLRYDAFEDMGGRLSFSAAFLDDHGDGLVLTSINGRGETRTYAKPVKALSSEDALSDEEREVIAGAAGGRGRGEQRAVSVR